MRHKIYRQPSYIELYKSGVLEHRAQSLEKRLTSCDICPRECHINRWENRNGFCNSGHKPIVSAVCSHHGEEPAISGSNGSGTIFFGNCNMRCIYCQNHQISQNPEQQEAYEIDCQTLAQNMIQIQNDTHCHNINFVSPSHFVPQLVQAVLKAVPMGLSIPLVYNSNGYDSLSSLKELDGIIDIYLPDIKYASAENANDFSKTPDYVIHARKAIKEMHRQVGNLILDESCIAQRGLIVRHLVLPNQISGSEDSISWLANELDTKVTISVMSQYSPQHGAINTQKLSRKISTTEYDSVLQYVYDMKLENGWLQELSAAENYLPDFQAKDHPFHPSPNE